MRISDWSSDVCSSDLLLTLINDILDFSKLEAGKITLEALDFDLPQLIESIISMMNPRAVMKGLQLSAQVPAEAPRYLKGDTGRLRQLMLNLVGNAIKFTAQAQIEILVARHSSHEGPPDVTMKKTGR